MKANLIREAPNAQVCPTIKCLWQAAFTVARESSTNNFHRCHVSLIEITNGAAQIKFKKSAQITKVILGFSGSFNTIKSPRTFQANP